MISNFDQILSNQHFPRRYNHFKSYNQNTDFASPELKVVGSIPARRTIFYGEQGRKMVESGAYTRYAVAGRFGDRSLFRLLSPSFAT